MRSDGHVLARCALAKLNALEHGAEFAVVEFLFSLPQVLADGHDVLHRTSAAGGDELDEFGGGAAGAQRGDGYLVEITVGVFKHRGEPTPINLDDLVRRAHHGTSELLAAVTQLLLLTLRCSRAGSCRRSR